MSSKDTNPKDAIAGNKVPLWLLSPIAKAHWALAMFAGMCKYGAWNWRVSGVRASVYLSAMQRHIDAYVSGEETDPTDGSHHLGNIMACAAILLDAKAAGKLTDDRPPSVGLRSTFAAIEAQMIELRQLYADKTPKHCTIEDTKSPARPVRIGDRLRAKIAAENIRVDDVLHVELIDSSESFPIQGTKLQNGKEDGDWELSWDWAIANMVHVDGTPIEPPAHDAPVCGAV